MNAVAIDSGGTKIMGAVINDKGEILDKVRYENTGQSGDFFVDTYRAIIRRYLEKYEVCAAGIGCNGRVDNEKGMVLDCVAPYSNWVGRPIKAELEHEFHLPVHMENDCRAAVIGEMWAGAAKDHRDILGIIVGTGMGGCYIHDGRLVRGSRNIVGEIGHGILYPGGKPCLCGQRGCAERYISGTALWRNYNELRGAEAIRSGYEFFGLIKQGDSVAKKVLDQFITDFAVLLATLDNVFDPEIILIGGGLADTREYWWDELEACYHKTSIVNGHVRLVAAKRGNDAALLGAARMAFHDMA